MYKCIIVNVLLDYSTISASRFFIGNLFGKCCNSKWKESDVCVEAGAITQKRICKRIEQILLSTIISENYIHTS